jgi:spectinomycin phosphotransferase
MENQVMHQPPTDLRIINCLQSDFDLPVKTLTALPWGADINSAVYKAETGKSSYFVKVKQGHHHEMGIAILECLQKAKIQEIIFPMETKDQRLFTYLDNFTVIVHPFIEGENGFTRDLTSDQWITLGQALKQVHTLEIPLSLQNQLRKEEFSSSWRDTAESICNQLDEISATDPASRNFLEFMKSKNSIIFKLVDQARTLAQELKKTNLEYVLCHSDIHAGNVLIDESHALYIVDWDDPILAPKERDLMFIGGGVANVWNNPEEEKLFYRGYGEVSINRKLIAYYRADRILVDIAEYSQLLLFSSEGGEDRAIHYKHTVDMFEPRGVVELAFQEITRELL